MIEQALGANFRREIETSGFTAEIDTIDRQLHELAVVSIHQLHSGTTFWLVGENEPFLEKKEKLTQWLRFLGDCDTSAQSLTLPFADPYTDPEPNIGKREERIRLLDCWHHRQRAIVVTTPAAMGIPLSRDWDPERMTISLSTGMAITRSSLIDRATAIGYEHTEFVEEMGEMAWRGLVFDIFPLNLDNPLRIEFAGDTIQSLRQFDLASQRSVSRLESVLICAAREAASSPTAEPIAIAGDFKIITSNRRRLLEEAEKLLDHFCRIRANLPDGDQLPPVDRLISRTAFALKGVDLLDFPRISDRQPELCPLTKTLKTLKTEEIRILKNRAAAGHTIRLYGVTGQAAQILVTETGAAAAFPFSIPVSFEQTSLRALFLTADPYRTREPVEPVSESEKSAWVKEIQINDFVVHRIHGIGRFIGFSTLKIEGQVMEFLKLEYQSCEFLYVPLHDLDSLSRYNAFEGRFPNLDRMGGTTWKTKIFKAKRNIIHFARELLDLYALRRSIQGTSYYPQEEFEDKLRENFPYVETEDQKQAINEAYRDLEEEFPMDRLVCGDVSFGKTEVAIRAAARVVANHRQVAVLCPTTILAFQHYQTFVNRFDGLPVTVKMLSRMTPPAEKKTTLERARQGTVDILVGTHSLLARQVEFRDLGLYIIDEEQRFGVFQKEKLKKSREEIDVLMMTATPIPRTLSFALSGLQDITLIRTPPIGRLAVKNFIGYYSRELIVSAVLHEVQRDGQVYIVYNQIDQMLTFRDRLQSWLPEVPIAVLHAQFSGPVIEKTLLGFIHKETRVLLSTTIIENGIDIPAVNTLIIIDADRFGLTQLYQLRGRIGRSSRQAYAYFLIDPDRGQVPDKAQKRLDAIREFCQLGSGYKIAEFDLMLRGAGSLLGNRQHGHIEALGFDYYLDLLHQTVADMKGLRDQPFAGELKVHFSYAIEEPYIENSTERMHVLRRILQSENPDELVQLIEELEDRYGRMPASMERVFWVGATKLFARRFNWARLDLFLDRLVIRPSHPVPPSVHLTVRQSPFRMIEDGQLELPLSTFARLLRDAPEWTKLFPESAGQIYKSANLC